jgi:pyrroloquinoline quinone biosynthesis protein B
VDGELLQLERFRCKEGHLLFIDGDRNNTETIDVGVREKRAEDMAHWPVGGELGSLAFLARLPGRRVYIHINNTNPMLRDDSAEARRVRAASIEIAHDGMEVVL